MPQKPTAALANVPLNMLRMRGETAPNNVQEARKAHAAVLWRAAQIAGIETDKELAAALGGEEPISKAQLSAWKGGTENPQTWRWERHPVLGPAYLLAQAEKRAEEDSAVVITTSITVRQRRRA